MLIDSKIIKNRSQLILIKLKLINIHRKEPIFKLLFKESIDGKILSDFHKHCDDISNTLSIIEDIKGSSFWGYTKATLDSSSYCKS